MTRRRPPHWTPRVIEGPEPRFRLDSLDLETRALAEACAKREGMSLDAWLQRAVRQTLSGEDEPGPWSLWPESWTGPGHATNQGTDQRDAADGMAESVAQSAWVVQQLGPDADPQQRARLGHMPSRAVPSEAQSFDPEGTADIYEEIPAVLRRPLDELLPGERRFQMLLRAFYIAIGLALAATGLGLAAAQHPYTRAQLPPVIRAPLIELNTRLHHLITHWEDHVRQYVSDHWKDGRTASSHVSHERTLAMRNRHDPRFDPLPHGTASRVAGHE